MRHHVRHWHRVRSGGSEKRKVRLSLPTSSLRFRLPKSSLCSPGLLVFFTPSCPRSHSPRGRTCRPFISSCRQTTSQASGQVLRSDSDSRCEECVQPPLAKRGSCHVRSPPWSWAGRRLAVTCVSSRHLRPIMSRIVGPPRCLRRDPLWHLPLTPATAARCAGRSAMPVYVNEGTRQKSTLERKEYDLAVPSPGSTTRRTLRQKSASEAERRVGAFACSLRKVSTLLPPLRAQQWPHIGCSTRETRTALRTQR